MEFVVFVVVVVVFHTVYSDFSERCTAHVIRVVK
jgi:hypothetical protein